MVPLAVETIILLTIMLVLFGSWKMWTSKYSHMHQPEALPWVGTVFSFPQIPHLFFKKFQEWSTKYDHLFVIWFGPFPSIITSRVDYVEAIIHSKTLVRKSFAYDVIQDWLGTGLLVSYGEKWKKRRSAITPTFHFSILKEFAIIFEEQSKILVEKLKSVADSGESIDVQVITSLATLDIICETSMGVKLNAQSLPTSAYVEAIDFVQAQMVHRLKSPWLWSRFIYELTAGGKEFYKRLNILHNFTIHVINKSIARRKEEDKDTRKKNKVFLDILLDLYDVGEIDAKGIREEVDTFMFAGHDTTAAAVSWTLYELGRRPDLQDKLCEKIMSANPDFNIIEKVKSIKYLDYVMKEGLRLHPPAPIFARAVDTDIVIDNKVIPRGTEINVFLYMLHRNPMYWDDPDTFNPDRFGEKEFLNRNPYVYIPFSAGTRNCVGQKFAMLEEKIMLYYIVLNYKFTSVQAEEEVLSGMDSIHKSANGLFLKFLSR